MGGKFDKSSRTLNGFVNNKNDVPGPGNYTYEEKSKKGIKISGRYD